MWTHAGLGWKVAEGLHRDWLEALPAHPPWSVGFGGSLLKSWVGPGAPLEGGSNAYCSCDFPREAGWCVLVGWALDGMKAELAYGKSMCMRLPQFGKLAQVRRGDSVVVHPLYSCFPWRSPWIRDNHFGH